MSDILRLSLQIKSVFQNCIILFISLKVQRSTLLLNLRLLMLILKNKIGMEELSRGDTERNEEKREGRSERGRKREGKGREK